MGTEQRDMVATRDFDAPVERVWRAWSNSDDVKQWWGPKAFTAPVADIDFREGGRSLVCMRSPDGIDIYNTWTYQRIVPMERIEFIQAFADKDGQKLDPAQIGLPPGIPPEVPHVVTLEAVGDDQTRATVTEQGYTSDQVVEISRAGMEECLDKMATLVAASG